MPLTEPRRGGAANAPTALCVAAGAVDDIGAVCSEAAFLTHVVGYCRQIGAWVQAPARAVLTAPSVRVGFPGNRFR